VVVIGGISHYQSTNIVDLVNALTESGRIVVASGLNLDVHGQPYNHLPELMARANQVILAKAVCSYGNCHDLEANRSISINDQFRAHCSTHYYRNVFGTDTEAGTLTLYVGPMFADKSTDWKTKIEKLQKAGFSPLVVKLDQDKRYGSETEICLHTDERHPAVNISTIREIEDLLRKDPKIKDICIDEGQFFQGIYEYTQELLSRGYNVDITGLPLTFNLSPFGEIPSLMCLADRIILNTAICVSCGHPASYSQRLKPIQGTIMPAPHGDVDFLPGGAESYQARCFDCLELPGRPENKYKLDRLVL